MEILTLHLFILRNEEHYKFQLDFSGLVNKYGVGPLGIQPQFMAHQSALSVEANALNVVQGSTITNQLADVDGQRDAIYSGLTGTVKSALNHFDADIKAAATRLQKLFDTYGNLAEKPYDQETAALFKLVNDLHDNYANDIATVGVSQWVSELQRLNTAFDALKNSRYDENASKPQENLKLARKQTDKAYQAIVKHIDALIEVNGETNYVGFVDELNLRIANYNNLLAQRQGRNAKDKGDDDNNSENK